MGITHTTHVTCDGCGFRVDCEEKDHKTRYPPGWRTVRVYGLGTPNVIEAEPVWCRGCTEIRTTIQKPNPLTALIAYRASESLDTLATRLEMAMGMEGAAMLASALYARHFDPPKNT